MKAIHQFMRRIVTRVEKATMKWSTMKLVLYSIVIDPFKDDVIKNMVNQAPKILANSQSNIEAVMLFTPQDIIYMIQRYTNRKVSDMRRTVRHVRVFM